MKEMIKYKTADIGVYFFSCMMIVFTSAGLPDYYQNRYDSEGRMHYKAEGDFEIAVFLLVLSILLFIFVLFLFYQLFHKISLGCIFGSISYLIYTIYEIVNIFEINMPDVLDLLVTFAGCFAILALPAIFLIAEVLDIILKTAENKKKKAAE